MRKFLVLTLFAIFSFTLVAYAPATIEEAPQDATRSHHGGDDIVDVAVADGRFTTLVAALEAAELVEALQGEGPFTVFAPTDDAFAALPEGAVEGLLADPVALANVLLYHVAEGKVMAADVVELDGEKVETLSNESFMVKADDMGVMVNDANVIITDIEASNGVIHVIDSVILPPSMTDTIVEIAVADGRFTTLAAALEAAELVEALQGEGPFTVFAPTDDAFAALPEGSLEALLADPAALANVLLYHVVEGKVMAADVAELDGEKVATLSNEDIEVKADDMGVMINDANVIITDIEGTNGVIHVIDSVILPPSMTKTIVEIAVEDGRFTTLAAALEAAELVEALQGEGPFTVFAPTDDAFAALPDGALDDLLADPAALANVLLYHVVDGKVMAADVLEMDGVDVETLSGESVSVAVDADKNEVSINDALVIITDIEGTNGVIHVIDSVLLP